MAELIFKGLFIIITTSALFAAVLFPIQCISSPKMMYQWFQSKDKMDIFILWVYLLLTFAGFTTMIYGGLDKLLWWIPFNFSVGESLNNREALLLTLSVILGFFLIAYIEGLPLELLKNQNTTKDLENLKHFTVAELEAKNETIKQLESKIQNLKGYY